MRATGFVVLAILVGALSLVALLLRRRRIDRRVELPSETHPFVGRQAAIDAVQPTIAIAGPLLRECVDFGATLFLEAQKGAAGLPPDVPIAPLRLYHKVLESTDAAEILLASGNVRASAAPIRSGFEQAVELQFMHRLGARFEEGALAWYASKIRRQQAYFRRAKLAGPNDPVYVGALDAHIARLEKLFGINVRLGAADKAHPKAPWYRLFGDGKQIGSLEQLVPLLDAPGEAAFRTAYALLYVPFSESSHASDHDAFYEIREGKILLNPIRHGGNAPSVASTAVGNFVGATIAVAERFGPDLMSRFSAWYRDHALQRWRTLAEMD